jgi:hypothetical protein
MVGLLGGDVAGVGLGLLGDELGLVDVVTTGGGVGCGCDACGAGWRMAAATVSGTPTARTIDARGFRRIASIRAVSIAVHPPRILLRAVPCKRPLVSEASQASGNDEVLRAGVVYQVVIHLRAEQQYAHEDDREVADGAHPDDDPTLRRPGHVNERFNIPPRHGRMLRIVLIFFHRFPPGSQGFK